MLIDYVLGQTSIILRVLLLDSSVTTGAGKTGLAYNTSGLIIAAIADNEATTTAYTQAASHIEDITTLGTYAAPSASCCRFKQVDSTNHPGVYEIQLANARYAVSGAKSLMVNVVVSGVAQSPVVIPLRSVNPYDSVRMGLSALPNASPNAANGLLISTAGGLDLDTILGRITDARMGALTDLINGGRLDLILDAIAADVAGLDGAAMRGTDGAYTGTPPTVTQIRQELDANSTRLSDILTDTAEIQAELANGGRTDNLIDSIITNVQSLLDRLTSARAGYLDKLNITGSIALSGEASSAVTGLATKAELDAAVAPLATSDALAVVDDYIDTEVAAIKAVTDKLDTTMEADSGVYRFTANALEEGPSGTSGGGDATAANQATIIAHLTDIKGAGFSGTTDSLEALRDRGDSAWITGSGLSGSNAVTITVQDEDGANIVEASVEIWDSAGTTFYERKTTDSSGQTSHNLDDGTYTVKIHKAGYSIADQTLVVPDTLNPVYAMTAYSIPAPADSTLCRLYAYMKNADGTIPTTVTASLTITSLPEGESNTFYSGAALTGVYSSTTGLLYFDVIQGAAVRLKIGAWGVDETFTVPALATDDIGGLI